jgi:hypothetical protein
LTLQDFWNDLQFGMDGVCIVGSCLYICGIWGYIAV